MKRLLFALALVCAPAYGGYGFSRAITIDHTKAGTADSSGFTVLVSGTYSYLATVAYSGKIQNTATCGVNSITCPADLIYTSDSACAVPLTWEVEAYTASSGLIAVWVKISTLAAASDTVFYECYGNAAVSTFQGGSTGAAWDTASQVVYHFAAGPSAKDSSATTNDLVFANSPTSVTGQIGSGGGFAGTNIFTGPNATSTSNVANTTNSTVSGWAYLVSFVALDGEPISLFTTHTGYPYYEIGPVIMIDHTTKGAIYNDTQSVTTPASSAVTTGAWHHLAVTYDGSTLRYYVDGAAAGTVSRSTTLSPAPFLVNALLRRNNVNFDELKLATSTRSPSWILSEFNNQSSPSTFYSVGAEVGSTGAPRLMLLGVGL